MFNKAMVDGHPRTVEYRMEGVSTLVAVVPFFWTEMGTVFEIIDTHFEFC